MKKPGNTCDYTTAKNSELLKTFNALLRSVRIIDLDAIFAQVAESEASRFYISEDRAYELIVHRLKTGRWSISKRLRVEMLEEILRRSQSLLETEDAPTLRDAVYMAVNSKAPKFYLTPRTCRTLIYNTARLTFKSAKSPRIS